MMTFKTTASVANEIQHVLNQRGGFNAVVAQSRRGNTFPVPDLKTAYALYGAVSVVCVTVYCPFDTDKLKHGNRTRSQDAAFQSMLRIVQSHGGDVLNPQ